MGGLGKPLRRQRLGNDLCVIHDRTHFIRDGWRRIETVQIHRNSFGCLD
jgi:hypothetical protein